MKLRNILSCTSIILCLVGFILATCAAIMMVWGVDMRVCSTLAILATPFTIIGFAIMFVL